MEALNTTTAKEQVVLELLGIDKKWVRSKGEWVDQATLIQIQSAPSSISEDNQEAARKKWWKFWAR